MLKIVLILSQGIKRRYSSSKFSTKWDSQKKEQTPIRSYKGPYVLFPCPKEFFWGEIVFTATSLINKMSFHFLSFQTPCKVFLKAYPKTRLISSTPLKVFGCTMFIHTSQQHRSRLDLASKFIFLRYFPNQKGYKYYFLVIKSYTPPWM